MPLNSILTKKADNPLIITANAKRLFQIIYREKNKIEETSDEVPKINVSEVISRMAFYYEKLRNIVEYREEHLLRKNAILRILKRHIVIEATIIELQARDIAKDLLIELIRAGYIPNNKIPESRIGEIGEIIEKYLKLKNLSFTKLKDAKEKNNLIKWILAMAACEIEEKLNDDNLVKTIVNYMHEILVDRVRLQQGSLYQKDKEIQIYLGIHRIYLKYDRDMTEFILLKYFIPDWSKVTATEIEKLADNFTNLKQAIDEQLDHPMAAQLGYIINRYTVFFTILKDAIEDDPVKLYESFNEDPKAFPRIIKKFCNQRYKEAGAKLRRAAVRSIIYIFLTKMILVFILEVPVTFWFGETLNYTSLAINITFPPFLLFLIVLFTRVPSETNSTKIIQGIESIIFLEKQHREPYELRRPIKRSTNINIVFGLFYTITFFLSFGLIIYLLNKIQFNFVSIIIFLFFLTLISYFGIRIRRGARELIIIERKDDIFTFLADFFYIPIVAAGKWINEKFSRVNFFVFILDFIIEAPFKIFVEIAEEWTKYVKERKEEIM